MLEIDWKEVTVTFDDNKINLPRVVTIKLQDSYTFDEERTFTVPLNAETRNNMVYFCCRHTRDCINNTTKYEHYKNSKILK